MPWNQRSSCSAKRPQPSRPGRNALPFALIGIAVAVAVAALCVRSRKEAEPNGVGKGEPEGRPFAIREATAPAPAPAKVAEDPAVSDERQLEIARLRAMTPDEKLDYLYERAKERPYDPNPPEGRAFSSGTEQVMSWIFTARLGDPPPPLPKLSIFDEVHLAEIILNDHRASEDDSEDVKCAKESVALAKKELIKHIKEGGGVEGFLTYYRDQLSEAHHAFNSARRMVFEAYRTEADREVCDLYLQRVNAELAEKGIKEVIVPEKLIERFSRDIPMKGSEE